MSRFLDRVTAIGSTEGTSRDPDELVGASSVTEYVGDDESVEYVVEGSGDGLVRRTDDWNSEEVPGPNGGVLAVVTDRRTVFLVGECRDPDVDGDYVQTVEHAAVEEVDVADSLLSTRLTVTTRDGLSLELTPVETDGLKDLRTYIHRASMNWTAAEAFFDGFEADLLALEEAAANGNDSEIKQYRSSLLNSISELNQSSSLYEVDLPALEADKAAARERVEAALCRGHWQRARELLVADDDRREDESPVATLERYRDACEAFGELARCGPTRDAYDEGALDDDLNPFDLPSTLVDRIEACCGRLPEEPTDDGVSALRVAGVAIEDLEEGLRRTDADVDADGLLDRCAGCRQQLADAAECYASTLEDRGDDTDAKDDEAARDSYDDALAVLDVLELLVEAEQVSPSKPVDDRRARLDDKIERSKWEWVGDT